MLDPRDARPRKQAQGEARRDPVCYPCRAGRCGAGAKDGPACSCSGGRTDTRGGPCPAGNRGVEGCRSEGHGPVKDKARGDRSQGGYSAVGIAANAEGAGLILRWIVIGGFQLLLVALVWLYARVTKEGPDGQLVEQRPR